MFLFIRGYSRLSVESGITLNLVERLTWEKESHEKCPIGEICRHCCVSKPKIDIEVIYKPLVLTILLTLVSVIGNTD